MTTSERSWWCFKERKQMVLVLMIVTLMFQFQMKGCVGCLDTERIGLLQLKSYLKNVFNVEEEHFMKSWNHDDAYNSDCCKWERVNCSDAIGGHIVALSLGRLMPDEYVQSQPLNINLSLLHSFSQLQSLDFSWNGFTYLFDPIYCYKSFQRLEKLRILDLSGNAFGNSVLPFLSAARSLKTLNLGGNSLTGVFPPKELSNMTELRVLKIDANYFNSFSIQGLINFQELEVLDLSYNSITDLEAGDGLRTTKLKSLDLSSNNISDNARFKGLEYLVELEVLRLQRNGFNHTESIRVLKDMPKLQELDLSHNKFTDLNSLVLKDMPKLQKLDLSDNEFIDLDSLGLVFPQSLQVLNLKENQLSSTPKGYSEICRLMNLTEMDLSNNALTSMPNCMGNLTRLRTLELRDNQLKGSLSSFVSSLPSALEYLSLLDNNFNGLFLFKSLVNHTRLRVFKLSSKVGIIQAHAENSWVPLFQLKMLIFRNVSLGGTIPGFLLHQHDLRFIDLSYNKLTGAFPSWLVQNNTKLEAIYMNSNSLTEFRLPRLVHGLLSLDISSNKINESIPEDIGIVFPKLRYMYFASNHFHGTIPCSMGEMRSLQDLDMSSNGLHGQLPKKVLSSCYSLRVMKLSNNQLEGNIFPEHANLTGLLFLFLDGNSFNGSLGKGLLNSIDLRILDISDNSISGRLPLWIGRFSLMNLNMRGNQLEGPFPRQLQNIENIVFLDISDNRFFGSIPRNFYFPFLMELRLQSNEFMGSIPNTLFSVGLQELELLDLGNNNFSGKILNTIGEGSNLRVLLLRNNSFQGHIPDKIGQVLSKVGLLDLSHNLFEGAIPSSLANMSSGPEISEYESRTFKKGFAVRSPFMEYSIWKYTSSLDLDGDLGDNYIWTLPDIVDFLTKSRYEAYKGDAIGYMYGLDLSNNQLSGGIPVEIGELKYIKSLNFSSNRLTGSIPASFSKLEDLESLDLSNNKLDGIIPPQLANLNSLGYLDVSFNNLSGEIPLKGHLLTFDEKSYIGNVHLCGHPTNKSCDPTSVPQPSAKEEEEEEGDGVIDMVWFYWTCGAVYITTFLAMFAFLCIDSRWSEECFYRVDLFIHHLQIFKRRFMCK